MMQRIQMAYNSRGMVSTVTQYDAQSGGTVLDEVAYAYDDWGNLTNFDQDADSTLAGSASGRWGVAYSWEKAGSSTTPNMLRRVSQTLPGSKTITYGYGTTGSIDLALSRVASLSVGTTTVAQYKYLGYGQVVGTNLPEASSSYDAFESASPTAYGWLDQFGRPTQSYWDRASDDFDAYKASIAYDRNSNITAVDDLQNVDTGWIGAVYSMDNLNRVIAADQGKVLTDGSGNTSIDSDTRWRKELWTLNQTGNWSSHSIGDNSGGNNELAETGTFNTANEWTGRTRTTPSGSPTSDTLTYDKVGNMTTNGKGEKFVYDGFGRMREVRVTGESDRIKSAYRYNGLGMRISQAINLSSGTSDDDVTDAEDSLTYFANDERWRLVAAYASTGDGGTGSASLLERYVHHAPGQAGTGASSYIDAVVLRDRDLDGEASSTSDGGTDPLEERTYILQNWRADVVATARRNGAVIEKMQYTAYGAAVTHLYQGTVRGDFDGNGGVDGSDLEAFELAWNNGEPSTDVNFDGGITAEDRSAFLVIWATGDLSTDVYESHAGACQTTAVRFGYAGYVRDGSVNGKRVYTDAAAGLYHVRHRVYDPELGRWTRRDPAGYVDGTDLYEYVQCSPVGGLDNSGLMTCYASALIQTALNNLLPCAQIKLCAMLSARNAHEGACCVSVLGFDVATLPARVAACGATVGGASAGGSITIAQLISPIPLFPPIPITSPIAIDTDSPYPRASCAKEDRIGGRENRCASRCVCPPGTNNTFRSEWLDIADCDSSGPQNAFCN